ncbi:hypothetical protein CALCODRAFT_499062 [Calocera cornea HHB12733]|uniref:Uncharacterized protein n=1 Tax=Calocera cornea HHB12733 TaxID=1353952 RepID=A0A165ELN6_9BASI|nr:hypothetical protein CALCODRAFT_499062 [Calocera cornea HHB12733]
MASPSYPFPHTAPPPPLPADEEIIIVDDAHSPPPFPAPAPYAAASDPLLSPANRPLRTRHKPQPRAAPFEPAAGPSGRVTRASTHAAHAAARAPRKVKVKLGHSQQQNSTTSVYPPGNSFLGPYDRELDSSDEDLAFEEQFVLRVPEEGGLAEEVRKRVGRKEVGDDVWFKFKGACGAFLLPQPTSYVYMG